MIVTAYNPSTAELEKTYLSQYTAKGATVLPVKNNDRFVNGGRILLGKMGHERSELRTISAVATDKLSLTVDATIFDHNADDPIYALQYDKIRFYRATSQNGTYTTLVTVDIDVDNIDDVTRYDDTGALSNHWYKVSFINSVTSAESDLSDAIKASGYDPDMIGSIIDGVVRRVRDTGYSVLSMNEYLDVANEIGEDLLTQAQKPYTFLKGSAELDTVANQNYIDVPAAVPDFWKFDYVELSYDEGASTLRYKERAPLSYESWSNRYSRADVLVQDGVTDVSFDDETKRLYIYPTPKTNQTGVIKLHFYGRMALLTSPASYVQTPTRLLYRYKMMAEYYRAKSEVDNQWARLAQIYEDKYGNEVVKLQRANRLDVGTQRSMRPPRLRRRRRYYL